MGVRRDRDEDDVGTFGALSIHAAKDICFGQLLLNLSDGFGRALL